MSSRDSRLHLPGAGMTDTCHHACFMTWTLGIQTLVLELVREGLYYLSHLPSLGYLPFFPSRSRPLWKSLGKCVQMRKMLLPSPSSPPPLVDSCHPIRLCDLWLWLEF